MSLRTFLLTLLISIVYLPAHSELITVCASGCNQTTLAAAKTACVACTIQINDNSISNESLTLTGNTIKRITGISPDIVWTATGAVRMLEIGSGLTTAFQLDNLTMKKTGSARGCLAWIGLGAGSSVSIIGTTFIQATSGSNGIDITVLLTTTNQLVVKNCKFDGTSIAASGISFNGLFITAGVFSVIDSIISKFSSNSGILISTSVTANNLGTVTNVGLYNCLTGTTLSAPVSFINCLFLGNTSDVSVSGSASGATFDHDGFGVLSSLASSTNCKFSLSKSRELCDINNFYVSSASTTKNSGIAITGITDQPGLNGVALNNAGVVMGPNGYSPALCGGYGVGH